MTPEELDTATVEEAKRRWLSTPALRIYGTLGEDTPFIVARLAREGWTPPKPVDPDVLAFREWLSGFYPASKANILQGCRDLTADAEAYLAGARMATERERERAKVLVELAKKWARFDSEATPAINRHLGGA